MGKLTFHENLHNLVVDHLDWCDRDLAERFDKLPRAPGISHHTELGVIVSSRISERKQNAKRIRRQQLENWTRRETYQTDRGLAPSGSALRGKKHKKTVMFEWNVLLMDVVLCDDTAEVEHLLSTYEVQERAARTELVNGRAPDGWTPLLQCCSRNLVEMARLLIENGADLRITDSQLWTPMHAAADWGHLTMVKLLLEACKAEHVSASESTDVGKDLLLAMNSDGKMPCDLSVNDETLAFLKNEMLLRGVTPHDTDAIRHKKEADMLHDLQLYIDGHLKRSGSFRQCSNAALLQSYREMWAKFIAASKMPNAVMMHIAAANGYLEAMDLLLKNNFPVDLEDEDGWQPMHAAVVWNQPEAAKRLVEAGADIAARIWATNQTALALVLVSQWQFYRQLVQWDTAYKAQCAEQASIAISVVPPSSGFCHAVPHRRHYFFSSDGERLLKKEKKKRKRRKKKKLPLDQAVVCYRNDVKLGQFDRIPRITGSDSTERVRRIKQQSSRKSFMPGNPTAAARVNQAKTAVTDVWVDRRTAVSHRDHRHQSGRIDIYAVRSIKFD